MPLPRGQLQRHRSCGIRAAPAEERRRRARALSHVHDERRRAAPSSSPPSRRWTVSSAACRRWSGPHSAPASSPHPRRRRPSLRSRAAPPRRRWPDAAHQSRTRDPAAPSWRRRCTALPASAARSCVTRSSAWAAASARPTALPAPRDAATRSTSISCSTPRPSSRRGALGAALRRISAPRPGRPRRGAAARHRAAHHRLRRREVPGLRHLRPRLPGRGDRGAAAEGGRRALRGGDPARGRRHDDGDGPMSAASVDGAKAADQRPLVLLCECAGTMANVDFDRLETHAGRQRRYQTRPALVQPRGPGPAARADGGRRRAAARLRRLLAGLRRAPLPEAPGARPPARDRRHPRGLQLGPRRRHRRRHRQGHAHRRLVDRLSRTRRPT